MILVELRFSLPVKHLGLPKAVETSHRNVNSQIESINISSKFKHILTEEGIENPTTVIEIVASYSLTLLSFQLSFFKWGLLVNSISFFLRSMCSSFNLLTWEILQVDFLPEFHSYGSLLAQFSVLNGYHRINLPFFTPELFLQCLQDYKVSTSLINAFFPFNAPMQLCAKLYSI